MSNQNTANQTGKSCKEGKWTLGHYQMLRGEFANHTGSYNTPDEACASVGMKAWSYDPKLNKYVPYDPKYGCCRAECGKTSSIGTIYKAAFRQKLALTCTSGGKEFKQTQPADSLIKVAARAGREIGVSANQPVVWKVTKGSELLRNLTILAQAYISSPSAPSALSVCWLFRCARFGSLCCSWCRTIFRVRIADKNRLNEKTIPNQICPH